MTSTKSASRPYPAENIEEKYLSRQEKKHSAGLMRVNHAGEVSAQALYAAQAITARDPRVRERMRIAAIEEADHLVWCQRRLDELNGNISYLDPLWYLGSFTIGFFAGALGDKWNLGFVAETEKQVVTHLGSHLEKISQRDLRSRVVIEQMKKDEARHATVAIQTGAENLPAPVKKLMTLMSRVMTRTAYWI